MLVDGTVPPSAISSASVAHIDVLEKLQFKMVHFLHSFNLFIPFHQPQLPPMVVNPYLFFRDGSAETSIQLTANVRLVGGSI